MENALGSFAISRNDVNMNKGHLDTVVAPLTLSSTETPEQNSVEGSQSEIFNHRYR